MSFWDNVKKFAQPYADDDYDDDDYDDEEVDGYEEDDSEPAPRSRRAAADTSASADYGYSAPTASTATASPSGFNGTVLNTAGGAKQEVVLFHPASFNDTSKAADYLRSRKAVVVNMENVDKAMARRVVDFLSGCAYALDGKVNKIAQATYLFCPYNMEVTGDLENLQGEVESYI